MLAVRCLHLTRLGAIAALRRNLDFEQRLQARRIAGVDAGVFDVASHDGAFRAMHRHIDGDRWERVGSVRARRVQTREEVATLEGVVTALLGDWVLTADAGGSWPVSDDYFSSAYAFGDREPEKSGTS